MKISAQVGDKLAEISVTRDDGLIVVNVDGVEHRVDARKLEGDFYSMLVDGTSYEVSVEGDGDKYLVRHGADEQKVTFTDPGRQARAAAGGGAGPAEILSVMPGKVVRVLVSEGDAVEEGQGLLVVEAMKMENEIEAPKAGKVKSIHVEPGTTVDNDALLLVIE